MVRLISVLMVALLLTIGFSGTVFASQVPATGACPTGFTLHMVMDPADPMHNHVGVNQDLNGNGYNCMQMVTPDTCLIVEDVFPPG